MKYIIALDQGTTSSRAIVFDQSGSMQATSQKEFQQRYPQPGWVEHDPHEIWSSQKLVISEVLAKANLSASDIAAVGISNQRETTLIWDRQTGEPVHNAIVWQDRRTAGMCDALRVEGKEETFRSKTGLLLDPYFSGTKITWLLDNVAGVRERAENGELAFGTVDSWLAFKLSGNKIHKTDVSNASRTLLFNIHTGQWDHELLGLLNLPAALFPEVVSSAEVLADIAIDELQGVPLASLVGDQQAATMGQMCVQPGLAKNTYGTGCFLMMNTGLHAKASENKLLTTIAWKRAGETTYALEGGTFVGGAIVQWLRDGLKIIRDSDEVEALAESVEDSGGVCFVPALAGLGAPHWDPYARGAILGLTRGTTDGHIARAALEGIAFEVADLVTAMGKDAGTPIAELRVDGGASANNLLMQMQADLLQIPVIRPTVLETTAVGAAYLAGLAVGFWQTVEELEGHWQIDRRFEPVLSASVAIERRERWNEAIQRARAWEPVE